MTTRTQTTGLLNVRGQVRFMASHEPITCRRCRNAFLVLLLREGSEFNDLGLRHCPFCGQIPDPQGNDFFTE